MKASPALLLVVLLACVTETCHAQNRSVTSAAQPTLTLNQAEATAVANQPRLLAAQLRAKVSVERVREERSGFLPTVAFNATGVRVADTGTSIASGNITTSSISDR